MTQITVKAALPLTWLALGQTATVERTILIDGAIRSGALQVVAEVKAQPVEAPAAPRRRRR